MKLNILSYLMWLKYIIFFFVMSPKIFHVEKGVFEVKIYRLCVYLRLGEVVLANSLSKLNFQVSFKNNKSVVLTKLQTWVQFRFGSSVVSYYSVGRRTNVDWLIMSEVILRRCYSSRSNDTVPFQHDVKQGMVHFHCFLTFL